MKYLKLLSICLLASFAMSISATETARAKIFVQGDITKMPADVFMVEDDATAADFSDPNNGPYLSGGSQFTPKFVAVNGTNEYSAVAIPNLEGLKLKFIANAYETEYTMSFSNVSGTSYFLQKGDDATNLIPMTEDYAFTCAVSAEIIFTVVKQAAPAAYTRDVTPEQWGTICYPKSITEVQGGTLYSLTYTDGAKVYAEEVILPTTAGQAYVFKADDDATQLVMPYTGDDASVQTTHGLVGTFEDITVPAGAYGILNNVVVEIAEGNALKAYRAYIKMEDLISDNAPKRGRAIFMIQNATTGLDGAAINGMKNGKYIMNGRFMIVKDGKTTNVLGL